MTFRGAGPSQGLVALGIIALLTCDLLLFQIGTQFPSLRSDPATWGTYAAWASALLPSIALITSVRIWLQERIRTRMEETRALLCGVSLDQGEGSPRYLRNESGLGIIIVAIDGTPFDIRVPPMHDVHLPALDQAGTGEAVSFLTHDGFKWSLVAGSKALPADFYERSGLFVR